MESSEVLSEISTGQPQEVARGKDLFADSKRGERLDDFREFAELVPPTRAEIAIQLDQLGDATLAEVGAALDADAEGEGWGRLVDEPRQEKLARMASLDVLSEILSWHDFELPEKGGKDTSTSRPPFERDGEADRSKAAVEALLNDYDSVVVVGRKEPQQKGEGQSASGEKEGGEEATTDPASTLTQMEVDQGIVSAMMSKNSAMVTRNPLWDQHSLGHSRSTHLSKTSARNIEAEDPLEIKSAAPGGFKRKVNELAGDWWPSGVGRRACLQLKRKNSDRGSLSALLAARREMEGGRATSPTSQQDNRLPKIFKEQLAVSRKAPPAVNSPVTESQSSSMTYVANHQSGAYKLNQAHASSVKNSSSNSPSFSPEACFRSRSFREGRLQKFKGKVRHNRSISKAATVAPLRSPKMPQSQGGDNSQRMRFPSQQQKELHAFGSKVNWMGPGIEGMNEAHAICSNIGMDIKQLKKWISNHRPKEVWTSTITKASAQPAWLGLASPFPGIYSEIGPQRSNAAQPALWSNGFLGPFEHPPFYTAPPPWGPPPFGLDGMGLWPCAAPAAVCPLRAMGDGGEADVPQGPPDATNTSAVEAMLDSSSKSGNPGGVGELEMARLANADNLRQVLGRKLKDFDPIKVQKLVDLCKKYRQERSSSGVEKLLLPRAANSAPPSKKQATGSHESSADAGAYPPPLDLDGGGGPEGALRAQWGAPNGLQEPPPNLDALAAYFEMDAGGWGAMTDLNFDKGGPPHSHNGTLPITSSELVQQFNCNGGANIFGVLQDEEANLHSTNLFLNPAIPPHTWPNPESGVSPGYFFNSPAHPSLETVPVFPPNAIKGVTEKGVPKSPKEQPLQAPRRVSDTHMRGASSQPDRQQRGKHDRPASWPVSHQQTQLPGTYLFEKVLTASDTSPLGRIILPKSQAELHLPKVLDKEGGLMTVEDADGKRWELRYRFWPNNKSRIYVFEHTADFIHSRGLRPGDVIVVCRGPDGHLILNDRRRPCSPEKDMRATSEGSKSTVSSSASCTPVRQSDTPGADEHADSRTASDRDPPEIPTQRTWRQSSMEDVTRWALTEAGQHMVDCVNLDHVDLPAEELHMLGDNT